MAIKAKILEITSNPNMVSVEFSGHSSLTEMELAEIESGTDDPDTLNLISNLRTYTRSINAPFENGVLDYEKMIGLISDHSNALKNRAAAWEEQIKTKIAILPDISTMTETEIFFPSDAEKLVLEALSEFAIEALAAELPETGSPQ